MTEPAFERQFEQRIEALGYELVDLERTGPRTRPTLRVRIDRPEGTEGGITLDDCTRVSRALESLLDEAPELAGRYVLEVSSPGVERPLVRPRDFERFAGRPVAIRGFAPLAGRARRLEGELLGLSRDGGEERIRLRLSDGEEVEIPRDQVASAHLVFRWGDDG
jgi:ribosome maturation factor RimP